MRHYLDSNGDLIIVAGNADRSDIAHALRSRGSDAALADALEPIIANSELDFIAPEDIGALTDAPIIGDMERDDYGNPAKLHNVWWFPDYMVACPAESLARTGRVRFTKAA